MTRETDYENNTFKMGQTGHWPLASSCRSRSNQKRALRSATRLLVGGLGGVEIMRWLLFAVVISASDQTFASSLRLSRKVPQGSGTTGHTAKISISTPEQPLSYQETRQIGMHFPS